MKHIVIAVNPIAVFLIHLLNFLIGEVVEILVVWHCVFVYNVKFHFFVVFLIASVMGGGLYPCLMLQRYNLFLD